MQKYFANLKLKLERRKVGKRRKAGFVSFPSFIRCTSAGLISQERADQKGGTLQHRMCLVCSTSA